jgi:hypothetical protein
VLFANPVADVHIERNRFQQTPAAVVFDKPAAEAGPHVTIRHNTFHEVANAIVFRAVPAEATSAITCQNNLFSHGGQVEVDGLRTEPEAVEARIIWHDDPTIDPRRNAPVDVPVYFRKTFDLAATPPAAILSIFCDDEYTLWVNGTELGKERLTTAEMRVFAYEIAKNLRAGRNVLAVRGLNIGKTPNPAGLIAQVIFPGANIPAIRTDDSWKAVLAPAEGWMTPQFDDAHWPKARDLCSYAESSYRQRGPLTWDGELWAQHAPAPDKLFPDAQGNDRDGVVTVSSCRTLKSQPFPHCRPTPTTTAGSCATPTATLRPSTAARGTARCPSDGIPGRSRATRAEPSPEGLPPAHCPILMFWPRMILGLPVSRLYSIHSPIRASGLSPRAPRTLYNLAGLSAVPLKLTFCSRSSNVMTSA